MTILLQWTSCQPLKSTPFLSKMVNARTTRLPGQEKERLSLMRACWGEESSNLRGPHQKWEIKEAAVWGPDEQSSSSRTHSWSQGSNRAEGGGGDACFRWIGPYCTECRPDPGSWTRWKLLLMQFPVKIPKEETHSGVELLKLALPLFFKQKHRLSPYNSASSKEGQCLPSPASQFPPSIPVSP